MPSILPGYEYDIFISYRQKDNKYDGWVTEFVANLKKEIEATFKEDVSIYFDVNPHDGLLDTHQVSESLEGKLKCLIFIPIISQTYCDPKSFAWQHEFCAFNKRSKEDTYGRDIKLSTGNVASRILPVKIHDLDEEDKAVVEGELGGVLRPIEFIYKSAGVNRPLRANEDHPQDNLNKVYYRDQINKVANAVKEIIGGLKKSEGRTAADTDPVRKQVPQPKKSGKRWIAVGAAAVLLVMIGIYLLILPSFTILKDPGSSGVAVLPFRNFTGSEELNYYGVGMAFEIRTKLSMSKQFSFISSLQATLTYIDTKKTPKEIGSELGVDYLLSGLYQKGGNKIKVEVELTDATTGRVIWTLPFENELVEIFKLQASIAGEVLNQFSRENSLQDEKGTPTHSLDAYAHSTRGYQLYHGEVWDEKLSSVALKPSLDQFEKAIALDSTFADAWVGLIDVQSYIYLNEPDDSLLSSKLQSYVSYYNTHFPDSWQKKLVQGQFAYRVLHDYSQALTLLLGVLEDDPDNLPASATLSAIYKRRLEFSKALEFKEQELNLDPSRSGSWKDLGDMLGMMGDTKNAQKAYLKAWELSHGKEAAEAAMFETMEANLSLDELPVELKMKIGPEFDFWKATVSRNWKGAKKIAIAERNYFNLWTAYWMLGDKDSAAYWAEMSPDAGAKPFMFALSGKREKAFKELDKVFKKYVDTGDDKMMLCNKSSQEITLHVVLGEYPQATEKLIKLNNQFPDFGSYQFYSLAWFDKIRKDYPPFQEALNNLKRKPMMDVTKRIKL